jgi:hypothetical protein
MRYEKDIWSKSFRLRGLINSVSTVPPKRLSPMPMIRWASAAAAPSGRK